MRVTTSKSKNSESFYITKGYVNDKGTSTSSVIRKPGTLNDLLKEHAPHTGRCHGMGTGRSTA